MRATKYNKKITIQKRVKVYNEIGGWSNTWADFYTSWASVKSLSGLKRLEYGKLEYTEAYDVEMRRRTVDPDGDCQVVYDGKDFQISSINHDDKHTYMVISR